MPFKRKWSGGIKASVRRMKATKRIRKSTYKRPRKRLRKTKKRLYHGEPQPYKKQAGNNYAPFGKDLSVRGRYLHECNFISDGGEQINCVGGTPVESTMWFVQNSMNEGVQNKLLRPNLISYTAPPSVDSLMYKKFTYSQVQASEITCHISVTDQSLDIGEFCAILVPLTYQQTQVPNLITPTAPLTLESRPFGATGVGNYGILADMPRAVIKRGQGNASGQGQITLRSRIHQDTMTTQPFWQSDVAHYSEVGGQSEGSGVAAQYRNYWILFIYCTDPRVTGGIHYTVRVKMKFWVNAWEPYPLTALT